MKPSEASKKLEFHLKQICNGCVHPSMVGWCENYCQLPEALKMAISALEKQERDRWVPCKESLPEEGGKYRVTVKYQWGRCVTDCYWNNKYKRFEKWSNYDGCTMPMFEVVAWKPLEEPYEAEKES